MIKMTHAIKTNSCRKDGRVNRTFRYIFNNIFSSTPTINQSINHIGDLLQRRGEAAEAEEGEGSEEEEGKEERTVRTVWKGKFSLLLLFTNVTGCIKFPTT